MKMITLYLPDDLDLSEEEVRNLLAAKLIEVGRLSPKQAEKWPTLLLVSVVGHPMTEAEAAEIKHIIGLYYAEKATRLMNEQWDANGWTAATMEQWLTGRMRSSTRKAS